MHLHETSAVSEVQGRENRAISLLLSSHGLQSAFPWGWANGYFGRGRALSNRNVIQVPHLRFLIVHPSSSVRFCTHLVKFSLLIGSYFSMVPLSVSGSTCLTDSGFKQRIGQIYFNHYVQTSSKAMMCGPALCYHEHGISTTGMNTKQSPSSLSQLYLIRDLNIFLWSHVFFTLPPFTSKPKIIVLLF